MGSGRQIGSSRLPAHFFKIQPFEIGCGSLSRVDHAAEIALPHQPDPAPNLAGTEIGYQTNTLVYGAANYRFMDFAKIGLPMNIVVGFAACLAISLFY